MQIQRLDDGDFLIHIDCDLRSVAERKMFIAKDEDGNAIVPEVCICFDNILMRGNRTTKNNSDNFRAFRSENFPLFHACSHRSSNSLFPVLP